MVCIVPIPDFTFICPTELADLADLYDSLEIGCEVYSVSTDTHFVHKAWHDASGQLRKSNIPCWQTHRQTLKGFRLSEDGSCSRQLHSQPNLWLTRSSLTISTTPRAFKKVQAAQFVWEHGDEVCPPSEARRKTLKPSLNLQAI